MRTSRSAPALVVALAAVAVVVVVLTAGAFVLARATGGDRGPQAEVSLSITHTAGRSEVTQTVRPTADGELPETVTLTLPQRVQGVASPDFQYESVTDGTGRALDIVPVPDRFGHQVTARRTGTGELSVTLVVRDEPSGPVVPNATFTGVVITRVRVEAEPAGWRCLTLRSSKSTMLFRPCTWDGAVLPGQSNSLGQLRWQSPGAALPTVTS